MKWNGIPLHTGLGKGPLLLFYRLSARTAREYALPTSNRLCRVLGLCRIKEYSEYVVPILMTGFIKCLIAAVAATAAFPGTSVCADDLAERSARSSAKVADALAENYGHSMKQISYIPALALWGRLRLAEMQGAKIEIETVREDVKQIADAAPVPTEWSSGSVLAGHLIYGVLGDLDRLLMAATHGLDDLGKARDFVPGHRDMSDAVFMHGPSLATAYRMTGDEAYLQACKNHTQHMQKLCWREDGLYRHSPLNEAAWGRGNGFPALGLALILSELDTESKAFSALRDDWQRHLIALIKHQDADGMWHQVIDHPESYAEFSCTSMIGFAMLRGIREGWLPKREFEEPADRAWTAIKKRIRMDGEFLEGVCTGTGKQTSLQAYFDRKEIHGRDDRGGAMALMFATERMAWEKERDSR